MKTTRLNLVQLLLAAVVALPLVSHAEDDAPPMPMGGPGGFAGPGGPGMPGMPGMPGGPAGFGGPEGPGFPGRGPWPFHRLQLTEAQEDKVFSIMHDQAPYLHEQRKAEEKALRALHELRDAAKFDDAAAAKLTQAAAQAHANIMLAEIRTHQKLLALLTPEQRKQLDERKPPHLPRH